MVTLTNEMVWGDIVDCEACLVVGSYSAVSKGPSLAPLGASSCAFGKALQLCSPMRLIPRDPT